MSATVSATCRACISHDNSEQRQRKLDTPVAGSATNPGFPIFAGSSLHEQHSDIVFVALHGNVHFIPMPSRLEVQGPSADAEIPDANFGEEIRQNWPPERNLLLESINLNSHTRLK